MNNVITIAIAQLNQRVGDLRGNADTMLEWREKATLESGAVDLIIFPELQLVGYPPEDLVLKPIFIKRAQIRLEKLAKATSDGGPGMLVGSVFADNGSLYNGVALLSDGKISAIRYKHELPNYGTFDEKRLFSPGPLPEPIEFMGVKLGVAICEDIWFPTVCAHLKSQDADILIAPHGSPYEIDKDDKRQTSIASARVRETGLPIIFINRVGGQDELVFDGCSFILNADGGRAHQLPDWQESLRITTWAQDKRDRDKRGWECDSGDICAWDEHPADIYNAMIMGLRDYVNCNGFPGVVLGLSGGIDSALSAAVAVDALGADRVWCVMMPSRYTSDESLADARECAELLGCKLDTIAISPATMAFDTMLSDSFVGQGQDTTEENIQSRIRGVTLMALSNKFGHMLLTTGNKSEMAVGYATIYGDMAGGYSVLKDAYKLTVFALSRWRNNNKPSLGLGPKGPVMPSSVIEKPPSAELRDGQKDSDSLPEYEILDAILYTLIEEEGSVDNLVQRGFERKLVERIEKLLYIAEYKRRQAPPGVKLGSRNFGRDRRYPITNAFRSR